MRFRFDIARLGRWALLIAPLLIATALFLTVFSTWRGVSTATDLLIRGQADVVGERVRAALAEIEGPPTSAALAALVADLDDEGLTYLGMFDADGRLVADGGTATGPVRPGVISRGEWARIGDRVRMERRAFGRRRGGPVVPRDRAPVPTMVLEFEPRAAQTVAANARETLAIGSLAAGGFLIVALVLVRWLLRREATERRREHERRLASLGRMSAVLAHEIKNPLASLKGNAQLLARALPDGDKPRQKAERVVSEAVRLESLVNGLLEFARTGALRRAEIDPVALARDVVAAQAAAARMSVEVGPRVPARWSIDAERLREVLANLLDNAAQASDDGAIVLSVTLEDGELVYAVRDRGPGVSPEDLERIFEPFTTTRTHGTGLGLAVARRFVELHGGTLVAENADGGGARFTARIPR